MTAQARGGEPEGAVDPRGRPLDLAGALAAGDGTCPMPSAHDKVHEAHYFIHQLIENYHYPH
jgi:hypothetical protein